MFDIEIFNFLFQNFKSSLYIWLKESLEARLRAGKKGTEYGLSSVPNKPVCCL